MNEGVAMNSRRDRHAWSAYIVPLLVVCLLLSQPLVARAQTTDGSGTLVEMVKDVVLGAAQWGIEEAGVKIFGNAGWKLCKVVLKPGMDSLQRRYPQLFDTSAAGTPAAQSAAKEAAAWVQQDRQFQTSIVEQLKVLDQARRDQLAMIISLKQANAEEHRQLHEKLDDLRRAVARVERQATYQAQSVVRRAPSSQSFVQTENWYAKATKARDLNEKTRLYTEAINFNQNTVNAYIGRGIAYFDLKDFNSARADFERVIALDRSYALAYTNRGAASQNLNRVDEAIADYRASMRLDPTITHNYDNLTGIYAARKNYTEAYAVAKLRLQQTAPADQATAYGAAAWWALFARDFQNAIAYSKRGLAINPDEKWINTNLAHGYLFTGQFASAQSIYLEYTGIKLSDLYWDEVILNDFRDLEAAGVWHERMNDIRVSLNGNLSYHLLFERRFHQAAMYARTGLKLDPNAIWIKSNLAHSLLFRNQLSQALTIYDAYAGWTVLDKRWEQTILDDFAALKAGGIRSASMDEISTRMLASMRRVQVGLR
jgi:tetratricopeptide (TPR) repeat protein